MVQAPKRFKLLKNYLAKVEIKKQLYIVYLIACILPILIIGIFLLINTKNLVLNQHYSQASADNTRVRSILLDTSISLTNMSDNLFQDDALQRVLSAEYPTAEDSYAACRRYSLLDYFAANYTEISAMYLYYNNKTMHDYGRFKAITPEIMATDWYQKAVSSYGYHWMTATREDVFQNSVSELALIRKIPVHGSRDFAILFISVSNNYLKSRINTSPLVTEATVNDNPLFYSSLRDNIGGKLGFEIDYEQQYFTYEGIGRYHGEQALMHISTLAPIKSRDKLYIVTLDYEAVSNTTRIIRICLAIVFVSLLVPLIMVYLFSKTFSRRIKTLREEMHKVSIGQLDIIDDFNGNDELVDLYRDLKVMIEAIKSRDEEIYKEKIARQQLINHQQEMQFEMLASQINPHFLFNTLETIRMKAHCAGDEEVATGIKLLGKSMRHVLKIRGKVTSLKSELEYIAVYLDIQKLRFKDRINYEIQVSPEIDTEAYKILPLLLQPIVENAFIHGLESIESGGFIHIQIAREKDYLVVSVTDNGAGISEKKLNALMERLNCDEMPSGEKSMGLLNISQRIKLFYGKDYGLDIESTLGKGTCVRVRLPLHFNHEEQISQTFFAHIPE